MDRQFAGIGSREVPNITERFMLNIAKRLCSLGYHLRSGGARKKKTSGNDVFSADHLFENVWNELNGSGTIVTECRQKESKLRKLQTSPHIDVWTPNDYLMACAEAYYKDHNIIPHYNVLSGYARLLHLRNAYQVLVYDATKTQQTNMVDFVVCYANLVNGSPKGGTRTAITLANTMGVPVFNLYKPSDRWALVAFLERMEDMVYGQKISLETFTQDSIRSTIVGSRN